ncbi:glycyl-tRNA synthetase beta chain [Peribacillus deserti]|uniref:Glycine--tRNA ligase beta subunit n=1 Tax=Peribacillus deserti TaxID=673318 RepID=A0ABS2QFP2_9BACI|nr:glycine--tRNA ligase subunit beta [Peribacillus deserti]MBM7691795.1 glycyl-tRNA synthetase beta chain [Peribacillus deserti]
MSKQDILLEIGLEEMPARFVTSSMNQLKDKINAWLNEKQIEFSELTAFSTPRRLAVWVKGAAESQKDINEEAKGPAKKIALDGEGNWSKAAVGFARGQGVSVEDIFFKELNGIEYVYVNKFIKGKPTRDLLPELKDIITSLNFPKNMKWADEDLRFVRPIKWLIALFGEEIIPFGITDVKTGNKSRGHRFLGSDVLIQSPAQYEKLLKEQFVISDPAERKQLIITEIKAIEKTQNWEIPIDEDLLEEVNNLVEYPSALFGKFEEEFLELPEEVLVTSMKEHQRYFPVKDKKGSLLPYFITVRNGNKEHLDTVAKGNEKVLRARLADASFFFKEDQKTTIEESLKKLETIVYQVELGTLADKVKRVRRLAAQISKELNLSEKEQSQTDRAAEIGKFDLVSHMVYEFPELQGFMGEKYARLKGEDAEVAAAINEHYMPRNAEDAVPPSVIGSVLSIAEKLDTIASCFSIGIIPTGSQDPYALRRQASGIVAVLEKTKWNLPLEDLLDMSLDIIEEEGFAKKSRADIRIDLRSFFKMRIKHLLNEKAIRYDLIDSVLESDAGAISSLVERAQVLEDKKNEPAFKGSIEALSRVMNISSKASANVTPDPGLFENEYEQSLFTKYQIVADSYEQQQSEEEKFELLVSMKKEIEQYFDHTMVMAEDEKVKNNRLALLSEITSVIRKYAEFNKIITG